MKLQDYARLRAGCPVAATSLRLYDMARDLIASRKGLEVSGDIVPTRWPEIGALGAAPVRIVRSQGVRRGIGQSLTTLGRP